MSKAHYFEMEKPQKQTMDIDIEKLRMDIKGLVDFTCEGFCKDCQYKVDGRTIEEEGFCTKDDALENQILPLVLPLIEQAKLCKTKVVCLCGSTRFTGEMLVKQWELR